MNDVKTLAASTTKSATLVVRTTRRVRRRLLFIAKSGPLRFLATCLLLMFSTLASATSYRCDDGGHVTYSDVPCTSGTQTGIVSGTVTPNAEDRAAAAARQKVDAAKLAELARERREDERAAALAARRGADRGNSMRSCAKLAKEARRAHDDYDIAGPRQQPKARLRMQRADEDYAALCKRKP